MFHGRLSEFHRDFGAQEIISLKKIGILFICSILGKKVSLCHYRVIGTGIYRY